MIKKRHSIINLRLLAILSALKYYLFNTLFSKLVRILSFDRYFSAYLRALALMVLSWDLFDNR